MSPHPQPFIEIEGEIASCRLCALSSTRTRAVPGEGRTDARVMFVGEGPGHNEDQQGRPFVGRSGTFLDSLIQSIDLDRSDVFITNVVKCRPPGNRDPLPGELAACLPFLRRQIELVDPRVIVTLGRYSLTTFLPNERISRVHGSITERAGRHYFPMYHPAAALRQEKYRQAIIDDMLKLGEWLRSEPALTPVTAATASSRDDDPEAQQLALF